jgi:hypothetical protein
MTTFFVGQLIEAKPVSRKNKDTGAMTTHAQVTIQFQTLDVNGYIELSTENIQADIAKIGDFQKNKGKFVAIPYLTINSPKGTYTFPDENLNFQFFDFNPLEQMKPPKN